MASTYLKYMGSKRAMLANGLGDMLNELVPDANRFVDLFSGSAAVGTFVAEHHKIEVVSNDLQRYSEVLAACIVGRTQPIDSDLIWKQWELAASKKLERTIAPHDKPITPTVVAEHRQFCSKLSSNPITQAYGGHYFSAWQSLTFDSFRQSISDDDTIASLQLGAMIVAASQCVAAPGHTAQPFQPSDTGIEYIAEAWLRSASERIHRALIDLSTRFAKTEGSATREDANTLAVSCSEGDLVFIDPPYSGVHYSRFYHVLETIAEGHCGDVSGKGRYPCRSKRPRSAYSLRTRSLSAMDDLLSKLSKKGATAVVTFPDRECSNGLSGEDVRNVAGRYFQIAEEVVKSKFSSMGGRSDGLNRQAGRSARIPTDEIIFLLRPN